MNPIVKETIYDWLSSQFDGPIVWAESGGDLPQRMFLSLKVNTNRSEGHASIVTDDEGNNYYHIPVLVVLEIRAFGGEGSEALLAVQRIRGSLERVRTQEFLREGELAFVDIPTLPTDVTAISGTDFEARATMDVRFRSWELDEEPVGIIERARLIGEITPLYFDGLTDFPAVRSIASAVFPELTAVGLQEGATYNVGMTADAEFPMLTALNYATVRANVRATVDAMFPSMQAGGRLVYRHIFGVATFPMLSASGRSGLALASEGTATFPMLLASAAARYELVANARASFPELEGSASLAISLRSAGSATFPMLQASAVALAMRAQALANFPMLQASGVSAIEADAYSVAEFPMLQAAAAIELQVGAAAAATFPVLQASGVSAALTGASASAMFPMLEAEALASAIIFALAEASFPEMEAEASLELGAGASAYAEFPMLLAEGVSGSEVDTEANATFPLLEATGVLAFAPVIESFGTVAATSFTLPEGDPDDLIVVIARRHNNVVAPSQAAGFTSPSGGVTSGNGRADRASYSRRGAATTFGPFANATRLFWAVVKFAGTPDIAAGLTGNSGTIDHAQMPVLYPASIVFGHTRHSPTSPAPAGSTVLSNEGDLSWSSSGLTDAWEPAPTSGLGVQQWIDSAISIPPQWAVPVLSEADLPPFSFSEGTGSQTFSVASKVLTPVSLYELVGATNGVTIDSASGIVTVPTSASFSQTSFTVRAHKLGGGYSEFSVLVSVAAGDVFFQGSPATFLGSPATWRLS